MFVNVPNRVSKDGLQILLVDSCAAENFDFRKETRIFELIVGGFERLFYCQSNSEVVYLSQRIELRPSFGGDASRLLLLNCSRFVHV
ncbi:hypothetical protein TNCT_8231 [Trichonephila clavata]|uniref:Uncharacterized protein n=1 Tax=Trichonephila clavata TaxID=2740835 RepID=A0A8X6LFV8_TRICU|nr:hypothetical protein TNCT_8231 [Trichonephila clavata]